MAKRLIEEITAAGLAEHPAVRAWSELRSEHVQPERIEILKGPMKKHRKSAVYRLSGVGPKGSAVIAKQCKKTSAVIERTIYEEILPRLPIPALRFYGYVDQPQDEFCWLFLEDSGEENYSPVMEEHRAGAARWLGLLHRSAARVAGAARLPDRGPRHYLQHLHSARDTIQHHWSNPTLSKDDLAVLRTIVAQCDILESRWAEIAASCSKFPHTLVHGDFVPKNVRARASPTGITLLAFDWEEAGWGVPAADLERVDLLAYWSVVRDAWSNVTVEDLRHLAELGIIFRCLASIRWDSGYLKHGWVRRAMDHMRAYESRLAASLAAMS